MYLYQPCLLTLSLYGWAFGNHYGIKRLYHILFPLVIFCVSEWELTYTHIGLYPASLVLLGLLPLRRIRSVVWIEVFAASLLGGFLCWKIVDAWPLLPGLQLFCALLASIPAITLCRSREDRVLACVLGSLCFELFFCLREYILFSFCVMRLGSREALCVGAASICMSNLFEQMTFYLYNEKKRPISV